MSKKLTNNIYQFEDNETGWGSQMNQNLKALDDTIGELKNVYKKTEVDTELSNKQDKLTSTQNDAINSGIDSTKVSGYDAHVSDTDIHVTVSDKANWNAKPNKSTTLSGYGITNAYTKTEIDNSIKDFATKSTTLGGYGITDAYTKTEIDTKLSSVYKYKGSVAQYLDLPTQNNIVGDVWNVSSNGMNYAWDGSTWDNLGATVDLSSYVKNTDYATTSKGGVIKPSSDSATDVVNGVLQATTKTTTQYNSADNSMFVSKGTLDNVLTSKDYATNANLSAKANVSDVYTQAEVNNLVSKKADTTSVYTKTQIDSSLSGKQDKLSATQLSNIANVPNKANASDVYNKTDIDDKLDLKQDSLTQAQLNACNSGITATKVTNLETHTSNSNIHVTTSDKNKWDGKADKATTLSGYGITDAYTKAQVDTKVSDLVNSAPETLDTLNELASALGNDPNFATTVANQIGTKANATDLTAHTSDTDIHVTSADKAKWHGKQDALSAQQIQNIADVTNKANDSDVVHKSGNETISDLKTFGRIGEEGGQINLEKSTSSLLTSNISVDSLDESLRFFAKDSNGIYATFFINFQNRLIYCDRECTLGTTSSKFKDVNTKAINGINPGALSLPKPDYIDVDTTDWDLTCQNGQLGSFTPTTNGWLMLHIINSGKSSVDFWIISGKLLRINGKSTANDLDNTSSNMFIIPVIKGKTYSIFGNASEYTAGRRIGYCVFMPCQGNV